VDPAIDQLAAALKSRHASVALAAARDILDRTGLGTVKPENEITDRDLKKLSTDELVVLDAIIRKAKGGRVPELLVAREQVREVARTLRAGKTRDRAYPFCPRTRSICCDGRYPAALI
jgi:hypothetical protein